MKSIDQTVFSASLNAPEVKREAAEALRGLISEVRMVPEIAAANCHCNAIVRALW